MRVDVKLPAATAFNTLKSGDVFRCSIATSVFYMKITAPNSGFGSGSSTAYNSVDLYSGELYVIGLETHCFKVDGVFRGVITGGPS